MTLEFYALIIVCLILGIVLFAYVRLDRKFRGLKGSQEEIENEARQKAMRIVQEANDRALLILNQAKLETGKNQQELEQKLATVSETQAENYKEMLQSVSKKIEDEALGEITDFKQVMEKETVGGEQSMATKIEQEYAVAMQELAEYKNQKIKALELKSQEMLKEYAKDVLGKSLSFDDKQELMMQAIEEAKKAYVA